MSESVNNMSSLCPMQDFGCFTMDEFQADELLCLGAANSSPEIEIQIRGFLQQNNLLPQLASPDVSPCPLMVLKQKLVAADEKLKTAVDTLKNLNDLFAVYLEMKKQRKLREAEDKDTLLARDQEIDQLNQQLAYKTEVCSDQATLRILVEFSDRLEKKGLVSIHYLKLREGWKKLLAATEPAEDGELGNGDVDEDDMSSHESDAKSSTCISAPPSTPQEQLPELVNICPEPEEIEDKMEGLMSVPDRFEHESDVESATLMSEPLQEQVPEVEIFCPEPEKTADKFENFEEPEIFQEGFDKKADEVTLVSVPLSMPQEHIRPDVENICPEPEKTADKINLEPMGIQERFEGLKSVLMELSESDDDDLMNSSVEDFPELDGSVIHHNSSFGVGNESGFIDIEDKPIFAEYCNPGLMELVPEAMSVQSENKPIEEMSSVAPDIPQLGMDNTEEIEDTDEEQLFIAEESDEELVPQVTARAGKIRKDNVEEEKEESDKLPVADEVESAGNSVAACPQMHLVAEAKSSCGARGSAKKNLKTDGPVKKKQKVEKKSKKVVSKLAKFKVLLCKQHPLLRNKLKSK